MPRLLMAGCMLAAAISTAQAENWPEHGYFRVQSVESGRAPRFCRLRAEALVDEKIFSFILRENRDGTLLLQFLAQDDRLTTAEEVIVAINGQAIFRFTPAIRDDSPELPSVTAEIADAAEGQKMVEDLHEAARGAEWFQVVALPYNKAIPAAGLRDAMDDLVACRTTRRL